MKGRLWDTLHKDGYFPGATEKIRIMQSWWTGTGQTVGPSPSGRVVNPSNNFLTQRFYAFRAQETVSYVGSFEQTDDEGVVWRIGNCVPIVPGVRKAEEVFFWIRPDRRLRTLRLPQATTPSRSQRATLKASGGGARMRAMTAMLRRLSGQEVAALLCDLAPPPTNLPLRSR